MRSIKIIFLSVALITVGGLISCDKGDGVKSLFFSVEDDKNLGMQVSEEIATDPTTYPLLSETEYPETYAYLNNLKDAILNSGEVDYKDEFVWQLKIIDADVLNAFATPGGYIFVYSGLIKYLDKADDLAGVLGHEIAHADRRHSIKQLEKVYGVQLLLEIALGQNPSQLEQVASQIATGAAALQFSQSNESEADEYSVIYLSGTDYACNGAASFFQKLEDEGQTSSTFKFLSTHPPSDERIVDINAKATEIGCDTTPINETGMTYEQFKASLPQQ